MDDSESLESLRAKRARILRQCTPKQRMWLREMARRGDWRPYAAGQALGYSSNTIAKWKRQPHVQAAQEIAIQESCEALGINTARVLRELSRVAFSDLRALYNDDGTLKHPRHWDDDAAAAVSGVDVEERSSGRGEDREVYQVRKVRSHSKLQAIEALAKITKLLIDRHELTGKDGEALNAPVINIVRYDDKPPGDDDPPAD